jgi:hypothetical protein
LVAARLNVGDMAGRHHTEFFSRFCAIATELGFGAKAVQLQWSTLVKIAVINGVLPDRVTLDQLQGGRLNRPGSDGGSGYWVPTGSLVSSRR